MTQRDANEWMWERAADLLERADKVQRRFFQLAPGLSRVTWEPPIDVFEREGEITVVVALPGVADGDVEIVLDHGDIVVSARRAMPPVQSHGNVRRLEIPQGRFERRIAFPPGSYELRERVLKDGCLWLLLRKTF
jgi:HSP20 family protein